MKHAATQELFSYWNRLRGERTAPDRADIDPGAIRGVLADTFMLDVTDASRSPLRIAGARINALFVNELKGLDFLKIWDSHSQTAIHDLIGSVAADPAPAIAGVTASPPGRAALDLELLLLPLRHFGKTQARILGCLSPLSIPLWLGLVPVTALELGPMRIVRPGFEAEARSAFGRNIPPPENPPLRHGHLRVHTGGNTSQNTVFEETR